MSGKLSGDRKTACVVVKFTVRAFVWCIKRPKWWSRRRVLLLDIYIALHLDDVSYLKKSDSVVGVDARFFYQGSWLQGSNPQKYIHTFLRGKVSSEQISHSHFATDRFGKPIHANRCLVASLGSLLKKAEHHCKRPMGLEENRLTSC